MEPRVKTWMNDEGTEMVHTVVAIIQKCTAVCCWFLSFIRQGFFSGNQVFRSPKKPVTSKFQFDPELTKAKELLVAKQSVEWS